MWQFAASNKFTKGIDLAAAYAAGNFSASAPHQVRQIGTAPKQKQTGDTGELAGAQTTRMTTFFTHTYKMGTDAGSKRKKIGAWR